MQSVSVRIVANNIPTNIICSDIKNTNATILNRFHVNYVTTRQITISKLLIILSNNIARNYLHHKPIDSQDSNFDKFADLIFAVNKQNSNAQNPLGFYTINITENVKNTAQFSE